MIKETSYKQGHIRSFKIYKLDPFKEIIKLYFGHSVYADFVLELAIIKQGLILLSSKFHRRTKSKL